MVLSRSNDILRIDHLWEGTGHVLLGCRIKRGLSMRHNCVTDNKNNKNKHRHNSSSSDSETSGDEELDSNILNAFKAVKTCLNSAGLNRASATTALFSGDQQKKPGPSSQRARHRLIYQTFSKGKDDKSESVKSSRKKNSSKAKGKNVAAEGDKPALSDFFIDKGPAGSSDAHDEVGTYDLTNNVDDKNVGPEEGNDVLSFDLTNLEESVPDSDKGNSTVQEFSNKHPHQSHSNKKDKKKNNSKNGNLSSKMDAHIDMKDIYITVDPISKLKKNKNESSNTKRKEPEIMKKCVITDDYEKQDSIQSTHVSLRQQKKQNKLEKEKTKGDKWYNMPATELTEERKYDLQVIQMRKVLDPKRFYRSQDLKSAPKYFQFGTVVEDKADFYSARVPKKQRKATVVEELLADAEFRKYNKRKFEEVQDAKRLGKGPYKHMKRLKKRRK